MASNGKEELFALVAKVPVGAVVSYGDLGQVLSNRVSGLVIGHWMGSCPEGLPWWRVVAKDGRLVVFKRDPSFALAQRQLLENEKVAFNGDLVDVSRHLVQPDLL